MRSINKNYLKLGVLGLGLISSSLSFADGFTMGKSGGLMYGSKQDPYWFSLGGQLKFDAIAFLGNNASRDTEFKSNSLNFRTAAFSVGGGFGKDWSYYLSFEMDGSAGNSRRLTLEDAYVTYGGWNNTELSVGQVNSAFNLENTASGKWIPFLERSAPTQVFGPSGGGLGVSLANWSDSYSFNASATVPKQADHDANKTQSDRWSTSARIVYLPYKQGNKIFQVGASGHYENIHNVNFSSLPEVKARRAVKVVNTTSANGTTSINSKNLYTWDVEVSGQNGPLYAEIEYQKVQVNRPSSQNLSKLHFDGYHAQVAYVLTGESRAYNSKNGTFNQVVPNSADGAWEIAARYSHLNLNDKDIQGGKMNNITLGVNWYASSNIRVTGNYIRSKMQERYNADKKRNLNIFGLRLMAVL